MAIDSPPRVRIWTTFSISELHVHSSLSIDCIASNSAMRTLTNILARRQIRQLFIYFSFSFSFSFFQVSETGGNLDESGKTLIGSGWSEFDISEFLVV